MMKAKRHKFSLSPDFESAFFGKRLSKKQIQNLKRQCQSYQEGESLSWRESHLHAYSSYFGFLTALKMKAVLSEAFQMGYHKAWDGPVKIIDFGAGTLGASLGVLNSFQEHGIECEGLLAIDRDPRAALWAFQHFDGVLPKKRSIAKSFQRVEMRRSSIFLLSNVLIEIFSKAPEKFEKDFNQLIDRAGEKSLFVFVEPAGFDFNQSFLSFRDRIRDRIQILLPCPHQKLCPALQQAEWCHEERSYRAPSVFWNLVSELGFRKHNLNYSLLVLGKQPSRFSADHARVVSQALESNGLSERWLCADGKRWRRAELHRDRTELNEDFYDSFRGDVLDLSKPSQPRKVASTESLETA